MIKIADLQTAFEDAFTKEYPHVNHSEVLERVPAGYAKEWVNNQWIGFQLGFKEGHNPLRTV